MDDSPRVPFIIGVSGNADPDGYSDDAAACAASPRIQKLRNAVVAILDWVRSEGAEKEHGLLDPATLEWDPGAAWPDIDPKSDQDHLRACWRGLGMRESPLIVLSSLGTGVDTIVAETALEYSKTRKGVRVIAPLPFPRETYCHASTFVPIVTGQATAGHATAGHATAGHATAGHATAGQAAAGQAAAVQAAAGKKTPAQKRYDALVEAIEGQKGFNADRELFEVVLAPELRGDPEADLHGDDANLGVARRNLRYRAAGEYVATMSHLLLAIYDTAHDEVIGKAKPGSNGQFEPGTAHIVEAKRKGLSHELLATSNNFSWADNGPVLVLPWKRQKNQCSGPEEHLQFRHPYDVTAEGELPHAADREFRDMISFQEAFNRTPVNVSKEAAELKTLAGGVTGACGNYLQPYDAIARLRRRAADRGRTLDGKRARLHTWLWRLILIVAGTLAAFEHWHNPNATHAPSAEAASPTDGRDNADLPHDLKWVDFGWAPLIRSGWMLGAIGALVISGILYSHYTNTDLEKDRYDYRALGEALRVQFYWIMTGTGHSVAAEYMQRQRGELDWIRIAVASLAFPHEAAQANFAKLCKSDKVALLTLCSEKWFNGQRKYFQGAIRKVDAEEHRCQSWGKSLLAAGLLSCFGLLAAHASPQLTEWISSRPWMLCLVTTLIGVAIWAWSVSRSRHAHVPHEGRQGGFLSWTFGAPEIWGPAFMWASGLFLCSALVAMVGSTLSPENVGRLPDQHNAWIILTAIALVSGGLWLAWAERNLFAAEERSYASGRLLHACAARQLPELIAAYDAETNRHREARLLREMHDLLRQVGCEALNENAEWLISHRVHPLTPYVSA